MKIAFVIFITLILFNMRAEENEFVNDKSDGIKNEILQKEMEDKIFNKQIIPATVMVEIVQIPLTFSINWNATNVVANYQYARAGIVLNGVSEFDKIATQLRGRAIKQIDFEATFGQTGGPSVEAFPGRFQLFCTGSQLIAIPLGIDLNKLQLNWTGNFSLSTMLTLDRKAPVVATDVTVYTISCTMKVQYY